MSEELKAAPIVSTAVSDEQRDALDEIARRFKVTRSVVLRWAIDEYTHRVFLTDRPTSTTNVVPLESTAA